MKIVEIFESIQGENRGVGLLSVFVRLAGCGLGCNFCDTKYSWNIKDGREITTDEVVNEIRKYNCKNVIVTGGEPLEQMDDVILLCAKLKEEGYDITIETNGTIIPLNILSDSIMVEWNVSPKFGHISLQNLRFFNSKDAIFKFVIDNESEVLIIDDAVRSGIIDRKMVYLMPKCSNRMEYLINVMDVVEWCKAYGYNLGVREHLVIWDNKKGV